MVTTQACDALSCEQRSRLFADTVNPAAGRHLREVRLDLASAPTEAMQVTTSKERRMASKSKGRPTSWDAGRSRPGGGIDANPKARSRTPDAAGAARAAPTPGRAKGIMQPVQPDSVLGAIIGEQPRPRSEVIKRVWDYIKRKGLQDQT